jgi:hypothetical protein
MPERLLPTPPKDADQEKVRERELLEAVARIYRRYGSDLSAFKRDVEIELTKRDNRYA